MKLSNSAKDRYLSCSESYRLHYIEKLRSPKLYSSLFFGSALDEAFSRLLLDKKLVKTEEEEKMLHFSAEEIFLKNMEQVQSNGKMVDLAKNPYADYYSSDFTQELLTDEAVQKLSAYAPDVAGSEKTAKANFLTFMESCKSVLKSKKKLSVEDLPLYNYITWLTLVEKGLLMVDAYRQQIMPHIFEVYSIQEEVVLPNETGDQLVGKIDFTCSFTDDPGTLVVCDNKTSSKPYKAEQTGISEQLATYCEFKDTKKAAYVVVEKKIYAKKPVIHTQILRDDVMEDTFTATFAQYEKVLYSINTGKFEKNFSSCFAYGRMCVYYALCKHNNSDGLINCNEERKSEES